MELGNFLFGHSRGVFPIDRDEFGEVFNYYLDLMGFGYGSEAGCGDFENDVFEYHTYWWGDDNAPEVERPNFSHKRTGLEIRWYKYPLRDAYSNFPLTRFGLHDIMEDCLLSIRKTYKWGIPKSNMVDISKLKEGFKRVYVNGEIESVFPPREVTLKATNTKTSVTDAVLKDATGSITLSLWGDQGKLVKAGSKVKVENGFITSFKGKNQLSLGKFGKLEVLEY